jgi:hypothetical protein
MVRAKTFSLDEVVARGFEASCKSRGGVLYFWHGTYGVRVDTRKGLSTLLTDPSALPTSPWTATSLGLSELAAAVAGGEPTSDTSA